MSRYLMVLLLVLGLFSCEKKEEETVAPEEVLPEEAPKDLETVPSEASEETVKVSLVGDCSQAKNVCPDYSTSWVKECPEGSRCLTFKNSCESPVILSGNRPDRRNMRRHLRRHGSPFPILWQQRSSRLWGQCEGLPEV